MTAPDDAFLPTLFALIRRAVSLSLQGNNTSSPNQHTALRTMPLLHLFFCSLTRLSRFASERAAPQGEGMRGSVSGMGYWRRIKSGTFSIESTWSIGRYCEAIQAMDESIASAADNVVSSWVVPLEIDIILTGKQILANISWSWTARSHCPQCRNRTHLSRGLLTAKPTQQMICKGKGKRCVWLRLPKIGILQRKVWMSIALEGNPLSEFFWGTTDDILRQIAEDRVTMREETKYTATTWNSGCRE